MGRLNQSFMMLIIGIALNPVVMSTIGRNEKAAGMMATIMPWVWMVGFIPGIPSKIKFALIGISIKDMFEFIAKLTGDVVGVEVTDEPVEGS